jgi:hypothetical protein
VRGCSLGRTAPIEADEFFRRRRRSSDDDKAGIIEETLAPGAVVLDVARSTSARMHRLKGCDARGEEVRSIFRGVRRHTIHPGIPAPALKPAPRFVECSQVQNSDLHRLIAPACWRLPSLDHLVRRGEQRFGDGEAEGFGGLEVDHQFELGWQLDW